MEAADHLDLLGGLQQHAPTDRRLLHPDAEEGQRRLRGDRARDGQQATTTRWLMVLGIRWVRMIRLCPLPAALAALT